MLLFQWNALRSGDRVIVHDDTNLGSGLHAGHVHTVESSPGSDGNHVAIRLDDRASTIRPRRKAVHSAATGSRDCWRCHLFSAEHAAVDRARLGIPDGSTC